MKIICQLVLKYMRDQLNLERCNIDRDPLILEFLDELKIKLNCTNQK